MYRTASKLPRRALFSAVVAGSAVGLPESREKLSIYPSPTPDILLVDSPSELEKQIGSVRRQTQHAYSTAYAQVQGWVSKWIGVEHAVENRVKSIVAPDESLTPGILYVGVATLTSSIIARNRVLPTRLLLPPIFLIASAQYFLPKASHNLSDYLGSLEDKYTPTLAEKHEIAKAHSAMTLERAKEATKDGRTKLDQAATSTVDKIQEVTGLKIRETLGWQKEKLHAIELQAESLKAEAEQKLHDGAKKLEKEVEKAKDDIKSRI